VIPCKAAAATAKMGDETSTSTEAGSGIRKSSLMWPMLTRMNCSEWSMLMQCNYEALEIWYTIDPRTNVKRSKDCQAMSCLNQSVPQEMWTMLGRKNTVKEAWEAVKTMQLGADRVKKVNARSCYKNLRTSTSRMGRQSTISA
jgi:hypothetical protein